MKLFKLIFTKYIDPTNHKGSRVKAYDGIGNSITLPWKSELNGDKNCELAALALIEKIKVKNSLITTDLTKHKIVGVASHGGERVFVTERKGK